MEQPNLLRSSVMSTQGGSGKGGDSSTGKSFGTNVDPDYEARLIAVAQEMLEKVEVKDRSHHFKTYKNCFIGKEAVKFLVWSGRAANVAEAIALGNALMQRGIFGHVTNDHSFKNEDLFYRFNSDSIPQKGGISSSVRASGGYSSSSMESGLHPQLSDTLSSLKRYSMDEPELLESRIAAVATQLQDSLPVRDRFWHLKTHKSCFPGRDAVKWLVDHGHAGTDVEAVAIGAALLKRGSFIPVASGDVAFKNDDTLYRFRVHDETYLRGVSWVNRAGLTPQMKNVVKDLMMRVDVRDRAGRLVPHRSSFFGKDAVNCLIGSGHARTADDAVALGNALLYQQVFSSVSGDYPFRNEDLLYRFKAHEDDALPAEGVVGKEVSPMESLGAMGWGAAKGERLSEEELDTKLQQVSNAMLGGLEVKDRTWHLKLYKKCFSGKDAVKFLMEHGYANSIDVAVAVGNALLKRGILAHVSGEQSFKNDDQFYRFKVHDEDVRRGLHWLSKSRGLDIKLEDAVRAMMAKLPIKDRSLKFKRHKKCFVGREAVQFLVQQGFAEHTDAALELGNALMDKGVFSHVTGDHAFKNDAALFYRFKAHEEEEERTALNAIKRRKKGSASRGRALGTARDPQMQVAAEYMGPGSIKASAAGSWRNIMQGLDELAISAVGVDTVLGAIELVGQESTATGLLHWGITHVVLALSFLDESVKSGMSGDEAVGKVDDLLGKAGHRCNEALQYKADLYRAAMMIAVIHHLRAVMHAGLLNMKETMAYFNTCLASGGILALDAGESGAAMSIGAALEDGEEDPFSDFLASQAANLSSTQPSMQVEKVTAADVHFKSAIRILEALVRMLPPEERVLRMESHSDHEDDEDECSNRSIFETVCDIWGMLLWEKSQIWAAVGRPWKPLLDQAVDKLREGGTREADIDLLIACHIMMHRTLVVPGNDAAGP